MKENSYYMDFVKPSAEYQPANYWFWQRIPNKDEISVQLQQMLDAGFHTFYIQPRLAFPIEQYLSEEYLNAYRFAIEQASKLGLKAGIYDDYNWNSGHGGGLTVKGHDEFRERQLFWTSKIIEKGTVELEVSEIKTLMGDTLGGPQGHWTYEGGVPIWGEWKIVAVLAYSQNHELTSSDRLDDLTKYCELKSEGKDGCKIMIRLPNDTLIGKRITAFVAARCITSRHINYLDKKATQQFIKVGYEPFKRAVGDYFGKTVFCMFMDHPHAGFYSWKEKEGNIKNTLMYDEGLHTRFLAEHHYPVELAWLSFIFPETTATTKIRGDFFETYGTMAREYFLGQISDWSHKNGLKFAGHELFGFLGVMGFYGGYHVVDQRTDFGGDYFGIGHYKDLSTVDAYNSNPQIDAKIGDSVARANGNHGCLLEQYYFYPNHDQPGAIGHWNLTYEEMRTQAIRHTLFGTKQFIFHGFYLTDKAGTYELLASSRFDFAPAVNYEPWFKHHHNFAQEISRLSSFIYHSDPIADIAVLYPLSTFWVEETDGIFGEESTIWHTTLLEKGFGFDIVDEQQISFDQSRPGQLKVGSNYYKVLVLPGVKILMDEDKVNAIIEFVKTGGKLMISGICPTRVLEEKEISRTEAKFADLLKLYTNVEYFEKAEKSIDLIISSLKKAVSDRPILNHSKSGQIWSWMGQKGPLTLIAMFNDGKEPDRVEVSIPGTNLKIEKWDVMTGKKAEWLWYSEGLKTTKTMIDLMPGEITCMVIHHNESPIAQDHLEASSLKVIDASKVDNNISIKFEGDRPGQFNFTVNHVNLGKTNESRSIASIPERIPLQDHWNFTATNAKNAVAIQVNRGWEAQGFDEYVGEGIYSTTFDLQSTLKNWRDWDHKLVFPKIVSSAEIFLNNQPLGFLSWSPYEIVIPSGLLQGKSNLLVVKVCNTGGNYYYAGSPYHIDKFPSGIIGTPYLMPFKILQLKR